MPSPNLFSPRHGQYLNCCQSLFFLIMLLKLCFTHKILAENGSSGSCHVVCCFVCVSLYHGIVSSEDRMHSALAALRNSATGNKNPAELEEEFKIIYCIINVVFFQQENSPLLFLHVYYICLPKAFSLSLLLLI